MLCEAAAWGGTNLLWTYLFLTAVGSTMTLSLSLVVFLWLYCRPTYESWKYKSNPKYPAVTQVRKEVLQTVKCVSLSTIAPSLSLWLTAQGRSHAFCGWGDRSLMWHLASFLVMWILSDLFEWGYHGLGHAIPYLWKQHKHHHLFFNPSPFAVIADEAIDQLVRAAPLLIFPMVVPTNMDVLFLMFGMMFYAYGVYMHGGFELEWPDAHHPWINTSYQHYLHHSVGAVGKPAHTGFWLKIWDQLVGADLTAELVREGKCGCAKCSRARGERTFEAWQKLEKPNYSPLLDMNFWKTGKVAGK